MVVNKVLRSAREIFVAVTLSLIAADTMRHLDTPAVSVNTPFSSGESFTVYLSRSFRDGFPEKISRSKPTKNQKKTWRTLGSCTLLNTGKCLKEIMDTGCK